jgi:hypothetical protein
LDRRLKVETARSQTADLPVAADRKVEAEVVAPEAVAEVEAVVEVVAHAAAVVVALDEARAEAALEVVDPRLRDDTI